MTLDNARAAVGRIVGRCHVGETNREVVEYLRTRISAAGWKEHGRLLIRAAILEHRENMGVYLHVMRGCR